MSNKLKFLFLFCLTTLCLGRSGFSQQSVFQAGVIFYNPTGISAKYWLSGKTAIDFAISLPSQTNEFSTAETNNYIIHATYLKHDRDLFRLGIGELISYYGTGGTVTIQSNPIVGIRGVLGLEYFLPKIPFGIFLEFAPVFNLYPASIVESAFGFGVRYQF